MAFQKLALSDFSGGFDNTRPIENLAANQVAALLNVKYRRGGALELTGGRHTAMPSISGAINSAAIYFQVPSGSMVATSTVRRYVYSVPGVSPANAIKVYNVTTSGTSTLGNIDSYYPPAMEMFDNDLYITGNNGIYDYDGNSLTLAGLDFTGLDRFVATAILPPLPSGVLDTAGVTLAPYDYYVSLYDNSGLESNITQIAGAPFYATQNKGQWFWYPGQPQVPVGSAGIAIYRIGGSAAVPGFEDRVPFQANPGDLRLVPGTYGNGNLTVSNFTYLGNNGSLLIDNIPDTSLGDAGPTDHNPPPAGLTILHQHGGRLYGAGGQGAVGALLANTLYFSNLGQPDYWALTFTTETAATSGGQEQIYPSSQRRIIALNDYADQLAIFQSDQVVLWGGTDYNTGFRANLWYRNIGIAGPRAHCAGHGKLYFVGSDATIYECGDEEPLPISSAIQSTLDPMPAAQLAGACMAVIDTTMYVCFPAGAATLVYAYDLRYQRWESLADPSEKNESFGYRFYHFDRWRDLSTPQLDFTQLLVDPTNVSDNRLLGVTDAAYTLFSGTPYNGIVSFETETDLTPHNVYIKTGALFDSATRTRIRGARIRGQYSVTTSGSLSLIIDTNDDTADYTQTIPFSPPTEGQFIYDQATLPISGRRFYSTISGTGVTALDLTHLEFDYVQIGVGNRAE